jgi:hypothetical protein
MGSPAHQLKPGPTAFTKETMMATFAGASGKSRRRRTDTLSAHVARIVSILLTLLYQGVVDYAICIDRFGISRRE